METRRWNINKGEISVWAYTITRYVTEIYCGDTLAVLVGGSQLCGFRRRRLGGREHQCHYGQQCGGEDEITSYKG